jgi:hypothetical protein
VCFKVQPFAYCSFEKSSSCFIALCSRVIKYTGMGAPTERWKKIEIERQRWRYGQKMASAIVSSLTATANSGKDLRIYCGLAVRRADVDSRHFGYVYHSTSTTCVEKAPKVTV